MHPSRAVPLLLALTACAEPMSSRASESASPQNADAAYADLYDPQAIAMGFRPLRDVRLAPGEREMRLWPSAGPVIPERFIRVTDRRGAATAEVYLYWEDAPIHEDSVFAGFESSMRSEAHCGPIQHRGGFGFCLHASATPAKARDMVRYLDDADAWSAADVDPAAAENAAGLGEIQFDGMIVEVEVRRGARYDATTYWERHLEPGSIGRRLFDLPSRF